MLAVLVGCGFTAVAAVSIVWFFIHGRRLPSNGDHHQLIGADKFVLITGSSSGMGRETAIALDKLGFHVLATCRTRKGEDSLRLDCSERMRTYVMDVSDTVSVRSVYQQILQLLESEQQGLWGLVNNAGILQVGPLDWQSLDSIKQTADVNLWGLIDVTKTFLPLLKKAKGRVVNMGSSCGRITLPYMVPYCISKYGVRAFSDGLRREMHAFGVEVVHIEAGAHKTKLLSGSTLSQQWRELWNGLNPQQQAEYGEDNLTLGAEEMLRFDTFASPETSAVTNTIVQALTSRTPKTNYLVGMDAKVFPLANLLPTRFVDWTIRTMIRPLTPAVQS
ncbi:short-chain dehydrogenase/reductase family 9C member 7 isoform X2 [Nematostella vectensis]|uniref:short-chain dehydrogenase/reductase family 9C member 7 isoform X2 n=1 Tax=Nematostella vectensis TaxID=45351 RepID=UPI00138FFA27|nr:short-chain dehydrogenase/reductase family 9C member 7 isoform X2 [Nematostella vectensis]